MQNLEFGIELELDNKEELEFGITSSLEIYKVTAHVENHLIHAMNYHVKRVDSLRRDMITFKILQSF